MSAPRSVPLRLPALFRGGVLPTLLALLAPTAAVGAIVVALARTPPALLAASGLYVVHPLSLWVACFVYVALVVEAHSGFDAWWSPRSWLALGLGNGSLTHEIHHGTTKRNLGFFLTIWDRAAGSFAAPAPLPRPRAIPPERLRPANLGGRRRRRGGIVPTLTEQPREHA